MKHDFTAPSKQIEWGKMGFSLLFTKHDAILRNVENTVYTVFSINIPGEFETFLT